jgi:hypothetical protein
MSAVVNVLALWAAAALLALIDALLAPADLRGAAGATYLAANLFAFFSALLLLAHERTAFTKRAPQFTSIPQAFTPHTHDPDMCCLAANTQNELTHVFLHLMCVAYVRTACLVEFRALLHA